MKSKYYKEILKSFAVIIFFIFISCNNDPDNDELDINGTWINRRNNLEWTFNNGNLSVSGEYLICRGNYQINGSLLSGEIIESHGDGAKKYFFPDLGLFESKWYMKSEAVVLLETNGINNNDIAEFLTSVYWTLSNRPISIENNRKIFKITWDENDPTSPNITDIMDRKD